MTKEEYDRAMEIKARISALNGFKGLFGLEERLFETNMNEFRELIIKHEGKIQDSAIIVIGETLLSGIDRKSVV